MNDQQLDDRIAAINPRPGDGAPSEDVREAERLLLDEIVATSQTPRRHRGPVIAVAAAACVVGLVAIPTVLVGSRHSAPRPGPAGSTPSQTLAPTPSARGDYTQAALQKAAAGPRLVLDAPGWTMTHLDDSSMGWRRGPADTTTPVPGGVDRVARGQDLQVDWYPAASYASYRDDRAEVSAVKEIPVLGVTGRMVTYERGDYAVMLPPADGIFMEIRSEGLADQGAYDALLVQLRQVSARVWLDSLPESVSVPRTGDSVVTELLGGVPLPEGFDKTRLRDSTTALDSYQLGERLAGAAACAWLDSWTRAVATGDTAARDKAAEAMASSRHWRVLRKMDSKGDYPEVVWQYADDIAAGRTPEGYQGALGCSSR